MIITKSGKQFDSGGMFYDPGIDVFYFIVLNSTREDIEPEFGDSDNVSEIVYKTEKKERKIVGYSELMSIAPFGEAIQIAMCQGGGLSG